VKLQINKATLSAFIPLPTLLKEVVLLMSHKGFKESAGTAFPALLYLFRQEEKWWKNVKNGLTH